MNVLSRIVLLLSRRVPKLLRQRRRVRQGFERRAFLSLHWLFHRASLSRQERVRVHSQRRRWWSNLHHIPRAPRMDDLCQVREKLNLKQVNFVKLLTNVVTHHAY